MPRYFIHIAYDGTGYHGWQIQPNARTVQETLEHAMSVILKDEITLVGAGRTDTGVHASFFMAHFETKKAITGKNLVFKLNRFLPEDLVVHKIFPVPSDFHARFSAVYRKYHYYMVKEKPLYDRLYSHYLYGKLDIEEIWKCCKALCDYTDFTTFSKLHTDVKTNVCHIMQANWTETEAGYTFEIQADRFLRGMVRSIVGTLLEAGLGKMDEKGFRKIIEARDHSLAGMAVPAKGLFLVNIGYPELNFRTNPE
ncbi:MAG TPA: tRNA pseudouridine(38-40) synthase TruA [Bacteroidaceae bacterium]|nr:tRNA pseudouridine(38-40) synthase TruA [Bacteroidaceae bacterium]